MKRYIKSADDKAKKKLRYVLKGPVRDRNTNNIIKIPGNYPLETTAVSHKQAASRLSSRISRDLYRIERPPRVKIDPNDMYVDPTESQLAELIREQDELDASKEKIPTVSDEYLFEESDQ